ncbi:ATP-binding protein [Tunicatimonas pelagia]|uniref:ATP-binding protein n=1 Tax=Tunicatimonas pelagia TaxID=931531 RepID=UPI00266658FC|nr:SbcC/MukB-like Walker B domain-containing protein [Tunicatimonas pelagia]WKN41776.1 ATP-binding protein [Tunicatimonas pelagia]
MSTTETAMLDVETGREAQRDTASVGYDHGYRLDALEVYNWGTFHRKIWAIQPSSKNALLTGDIGSGKSTLVDALTTLLVPHHRIVYNAAAGAQAKERSLRSYIRGEYRSVRASTSTQAKSVALREDGKNYSVLLARFTNTGLRERVTLAQVFWIEDHKEKKFFIVSRDRLTIKDHFTGFGSDLLQLKAQLRRQEHTQVFDAFKDYSARLRQHFGMSSEKTLQLFYQTVSMKSVDNLTTFVRSHMLDQTDTREQLLELQRNFENLQQAYESVLKARQQTDLLKPVIDEGKKYERIIDKIGQLENHRDALPSFMAEQRYRLLNEALVDIQQQQEEVSQQRQEKEQRLAQLSDQKEGVTKAYYQSGGNRIEDIKGEIKQAQQEKDRRAGRWDQYHRLTDMLQYPRADTPPLFESNQQQAQQALSDVRERKQQLLRERDDKVVHRNELWKQKEEEEQELHSLQQRQSQIPRQQIDMRQHLTEALGLRTEQLPFVGELLRVRPEEAAWEGAIERVLHGFALSLLVPDELYATVSQYVNNTNLRGRLVYYRTLADTGTPSIHPVADQSMLHKIDIKPDTPFEDWLEQTLEQRFNYLCADTVDQFRSLPRAITRQGLVKHGRARHEKDDRHAIDNRRFYVLGWSNQEKIGAMQKVVNQLKQDWQLAGDELATLEAATEELDQRAEAARDLLLFAEFNDINWSEVVHRIQALQEEMRSLEHSSDQLKQLKSEMDRLAEQITMQQREKEDLLTRQGALTSRRSDCERDMHDAQQRKDLISEEEKAANFPALKKLAGTATIRLSDLENVRQRMQTTIQKKLNKQTAERDSLGKRLGRLIHQFIQQFPAESVEITPSADSLPELRTLHRRLVRDDLPQHEARFRELLRKGTINDILLFKNKLEAASEEIEEKINLINDSLREIEYDPGTYIRLVPDKELDAEIRNFQTDLKNCLKNTLGQEDYYNEQKYVQVKQLLDRFRSEESAEKRWKEKVTDVRNWYSFGASERNRETEEEVNYYSDSGGKSGGQKEKLAYTVLASALAYQYGIHDVQKSAKAFRFVVIDEAFGRGSDESTRFGLELFKKMNLQLLVVTPLQKTGIIQHYIDFVHFVSNPTKMNSEVIDLTKKEYLERKKEYDEQRFSAYMDG